MPSSAPDPVLAACSFDGRTTNALVLRGITRVMLKVSLAALIFHEHVTRPYGLSYATAAFVMVPPGRGRTVMLR